MATRAIVPNANGEGSIGKETLRWGDIQTNKINNLTFPTSIDAGSTMKALVVNEDNNGFVIGNVASGGAGGGFLVLDDELDLTPLPIGSEYVQPVLEDIQEGDNGRIIVINEEEDAFVILRQPVPLVTITEGDANKVLAVKADETGYEHKEISTASTDTLGLVKIGSGISISMDGTISTIEYNTATSDTNGLMSFEDKNKLTGIEDNANNYSLPTASDEILGGIKVGENLTVTVDGKLNAEPSFVLPVITTNIQTELTYSSAKLNGNISSFGSIPKNQLLTAFNWRVVGATEWNTTPLENTETIGNITFSLTSLEPETNYEFNFFVIDEVNPDITVYGDTLSFTTEELTAIIIGVQDTGARGLDGATLKQVIYNYDTESISETTLNTAYFDEHPKYQFTDWTDASGNVFCEIPIAYWWRGNLPDVASPGTQRWTMLMSDVPCTVTINGTVCEFKASDATYKKDTGYLDSFYIGKYRGHNAGSNKVGSAASQTPWGSVSFDNFRTYCSNNGADYHMLSLFEWHEILARMTIEKKTFQLMPEATRAVKANCVYRGINDFAFGPGLYAEWMDGIRTNASGNYELWSSAGGSYVTTSNTSFSGSGDAIYSQSLFTGMDNLFISDVLGPNNTSFIPDWAGGRTSGLVSRVCYVNFLASYVYNGAFSSNFTRASSESTDTIGCRLAKW